MERFSLPLLRYTFVAVFFWFGIQQLVDPTLWIVYLPEWLGYIPVPAEIFVQLNGWLEIVLAIALLIGFQVRTIAALLAIHLLGIAAVAGGATGVRDAGLGLALLSLALSQPDAYTLDVNLKKD